MSNKIEISLEDWLSNYAKICEKVLSGKASKSDTEKFNALSMNSKERLVSWIEQTEIDDFDLAFLLFWFARINNGFSTISEKGEV